MRCATRELAAFVFMVLLSGVTRHALSADSAPDMKLIERGQEISRTVAGIGCAGCHGRYGEGDVGIGPYTRGVSLAKIQSAIVAVNQMSALLKGKLSAKDIEAVAAYYSWLGQLQLVKTLVKRDRFIPDSVEIYPGTAVQLVIKNSSQFPRKFAGPDMNVAEFQVAGREGYDFVWRAPDREGTYTLRCVDCIVTGQQLTINVRRSAKRYLVPEKEVPTQVATATSDEHARSSASVYDAQTIEYGRELFLNAGEVGCTACHGRFAEGDVGIGPYNRGFSEQAIRRALKSVEAMAFLREKLTDAQVSQIAAYYKWLGELELVKVQVVRGRFFPSALSVRPRAKIQLAIANRDHRPIEIAGDEKMGIPTVTVAVSESGESLWTAPDREGTFTVRCVNCRLKGERLTINVSKTAKKYVPPVQIK